jgi:hypothetical protein
MKLRLILSTLSIIVGLFTQAQTVSIVAGSSGITRQVLADSIAAVEARFPTTLPTRIGAQRSIVINDSGKYAMSQVTTKTADGWLYAIFRLGSSHVDTGQAYMRRTKDGTNWTAPKPILGNNIGLVTVGASGNRVFIGYQTSNTYSTIKYTYTDDGFETFSTPIVRGLETGQTNMANYGPIIPITASGDTILSPMYANFDIDTSQAFYHLSYDRGVSWNAGDYKIIKKSPFAGVFPTGGWVNEHVVIVVDQGVSLATTKLLCLLRSEKYVGFWHQFYSDDGGTTWVDVGITQGKWVTEENFSSGPNLFPPHAIKRDSTIYIVYGYRGNTPLGIPSNVRVIQGNALKAYNNPDFWSKPAIIYEANGKAAHNDFGYSDPFEINGQLGAFNYEISTKHLSGAATTNTKTKVFTIPLEGNNYLHVANDSDQVLTAGDNVVLFDRIHLDSERAHNRDSSKVYAPLDGWYSITASLNIDTSYLGSVKITASLYAVDTGDERGTFPKSPYNGKRLLSQQTLNTSATDSLFNRFELRAEEYLNTGEEIRVLLTLPAATTRKLKGYVTDPFRRATLKFKKSD